MKSPRSLAIDDRIYSDAGLRTVDGHMDSFLPDAGREYVRLGDGEEL